MPTFLLADDHQLIRSGLLILLKSKFPGTEILEAPDSPATLATVESEDLDLVILDINMPGASGLDLLGRIKQLRPDLPVLVLSGMSEDEYALRALRGGAIGYVSKNSMNEEIVEAVLKAKQGERYVSPRAAESILGGIGRKEEKLTHELLSARELQIFHMIANGKSVKEIGFDLGISDKTVSTYRSRIYAKTGMQSHVDITRYAMQHGLVR